MEYIYLASYFIPGFLRESEEPIASQKVFKSRIAARYWLVCEIRESWFFVYNLGGHSGDEDSHDDSDSDGEEGYALDRMIEDITSYDMNSVCARGGGSGGKLHIDVECIRLEDLDE